MAPCTPSSIQPPIIPPISGDFGIPIAPFQIPFPNVSLPTDLLQDLMDLVNKLGALFPSGKFKPNVDSFTKDLFDLISNLLSQIAPFLSFYNFIMALLRLIVCIIEVLCAIPNPFKIAAAMAKLFSECLPPFLNLFPFLALIAMIIALLLLILALIEYIIALIIAIIEEIIRNIIILAKGTTFQDAESTLSAVQKVAELMCVIENILAILVALAAIIAIIQALSLIAGGTICSDDSADGCCSADVCPPFIKESPLTGTEGQLTYHRQIGVDLESALGLTPEIAALFNIPPTRTERWQLYDTLSANSQPHQFAEIITPIVSATFPPIIATFWPEGTAFDSTTPPSKAPYTCDLRFEYNPSDGYGTRFIKINDCVVVRKPYVGVYDYSGSINSSTNSTGTLNLEGGLVTEDDGTPYMIGEEQATLNTFIHDEPLNQTTPQTSEDGTIISNVEFTMKPVYGVLMGYSLITAGCLPEVRAERTVTNAIIISEDIRAVVDKLQPVPAGEKVPSTGVLPNVQGAQDCVLQELETFRSNTTIETAATFQAAVQVCLGDLRDQTLAAICGAITAAVSQFKSEVTITPDVQFTSRSIVTNVVLKDPSGTDLSQNIPLECQADIADRLAGLVTLGEITKFIYDGTGSFTAILTSKEAGSGELTVSFDGKVFSKIIPLADGVASQIVENVLSYTFIDTPVDAAVRRDATDVAGHESNKE